MPQINGIFKGITAFFFMIKFEIAPAICLK